MSVRLDVELRSASIEGNTLKGTAHLFGQTAFVGGRYERMAPGSFDAALSDPNTDIRAFMNHDPNLLLGRQGAGTLTVSADAEALSFSVDLPDTSYAHDLKTLVERGDLTGASFAFLPKKFALTRTADGKELRTHLEVGRMLDVSPVSLPAFSGTDVQLRSITLEFETAPSQMIKARQKVRRERQEKNK